MRRILFVLAALVVLPLASRAGETVIRLKVQPMAAPKPALRYLLLPELKEMTPGNPIPNYLKCLLDQDFSIPRETLRQSALRQADRAARMDKPDWQLLLKLKTEGIGLLLPDLQKLRMLASDLKDRFHNEVAQGRFNDALYTAKTVFAMSRHMGEHPTLIGGVVALAMARITIEPLEEMLEQPGCPNLYWALTDLPRPFIDLRKGVQADRMMLTDLFALIDEQASMSDAQVRQAVAPIRRMVKDFNIRWNENAWLNELTNDEERLRATRKRLIEAGLAEDKVKQFSAQQVTLLNEKLEYSVWDDESRKAMNLPYWQAATILSAASPRKTSKYSPLRWLEKNYDKVKVAQARLDQRLGLLRCVEALRLHAAEHGGQLPEKLSDLNVPLPIDPFTGKPFVYKREGKTAHLRGTPPPGAKENPDFNIHYQITLRK